MCACGEKRRGCCAALRPPPSPGGEGGRYPMDNKVCFRGVADAIWLERRCA